MDELIWTTGEIMTGKTLKQSEEALPTATLSTLNPK
jgi:hypothetical protein